jgi:hypothetical protein
MATSMPTVTPAAPPRDGLFTEARRSIRDVRSLMAFRVAGLRGRSRRGAKIVIAIFLALTVSCALIPAFSPGAGSSGDAFDVAVLLPTAYLAFLASTTLAIVGAGGGRELLPRDEGVGFPISPTTDHLGALLLAPLNIAWMLQAWALLGFTAYATGGTNLWASQLVVLFWLLAATALAQALAWAIEWIRRGPKGVLIVRSLGVGLALLFCVVVAMHQVTNLLDRSPTLQLAKAVFAGHDGIWLRWILTLVVLAVGLFAAISGGAYVNHAVDRRQPREELKEAGRSVTPRPMPLSDHAALVRTDRASVWRSVPLRRGFLVLAMLPGLVAAAGRLEWDMLPILPGLVAAGGALLFGVNAWCLDATGALWRDSLPVEPEKVFYARVRVLLEILMVAMVIALVIAGVRASGLPTAAELASLVAATLVVCLQVVARSMHWSVRRPFAMDLRSSRGTPAPPSAMVIYSSYLALTSTLTGSLFTITSNATTPMVAVILALPFVIAAIRRIVITAGEWARPDVRAWVVATVSAR